MSNMRKLLCTTVLAALAGAAQADISDGEVRIGLLTDLSGTYSDLAGSGTVTAAEMATADVGGMVAGKPIKLLTADHQNKADIAANKAREWGDTEKVDAYVELVTTSTAVAVSEIAKRNKKFVLYTGPASLLLTNEKCIPTAVHYVYDNHALAVGTAKTMVTEGGKTWFFLTADYAFGHDLEKSATQVIKANGGKVLGSVNHPFPASDFSSFILQAQASKAQVVGLANAGADTTNAIKAANEFGLVAGGQELAALLTFITDVHSLGLETAQGLKLTTGFYWDYDDKTRAWSKRFFEKTGKMPTMVQAGLYSGLMQYFKAIEATQSDDAMTVVEYMRKTPIEDFFARNGKLRADGRMVHDMYLVQVKKPSESKQPWDYYKILKVIPGEQAYQPLSESKCADLK